MKTKISIILFFIALFSFGNIYAKNDSLEFKQSIINKITYPEFAMKEKLEADVWVKLTINDKGRINIDQINCVDVLFLDYVKEELQKIEFDLKSEFVNKTFYYKFTFKFQQDS